MKRFTLLFAAAALSAPVFAQPGSEAGYAGSPTYVTARTLGGRPGHHRRGHPAHRSRPADLRPDRRRHRSQRRHASPAASQRRCRPSARRATRKACGACRRGRQPAAPASGRIALREDPGGQHDGRPEATCLAASARISHERRRSFPLECVEATINSSAPVISDDLRRFCAHALGPAHHHQRHALRDRAGVRPATRSLSMSSTGGGRGARLLRDDAEEALVHAGREEFRALVRIGGERGNADHHVGLVELRRRLELARDRSRALPGDRRARSATRTRTGARSPRRNARSTCSSRGSRSARRCPRRESPSPPGPAARARGTTCSSATCSSNSSPRIGSRRSARMVSWSVPGARPRPRSMRPGCSDSSVPICSATTSGAWFGSMMPPEPMRIVLRAGRAMCPISTTVAELATPSRLWCSAIQ